MKNLITGTGLSFTAGQKLSSEALNTMNSRINDLVDIMNLYLKSEVNVNAEEGDQNANYTLESARPLVPVNRRLGGIKLRFRTGPGEWIEYVYKGSAVDDNNWYDDDNWSVSLDNIIDGGSW